MSNSRPSVKGGHVEQDETGRRCVCLGSRGAQGLRVMVGAGRS